MDFIRQGVSPHQLALSVSVSAGIGLFPILGTHTALSAIVIFLFRLNPVVILALTNAVFPLFFITIIPFVRIGEWVLGAEAVYLNIFYWYERVQTVGFEVVKELGVTVLHAIIGWGVVCLPLGVGIFYGCLKIIKTNLSA